MPLTKRSTKLSMAANGRELQDYFEEMSKAAGV